MPLAEHGLWLTAVRFHDGIDVAAAIDHLFTRLAELAHTFGGSVGLVIEPEGDGCNSGRWVSIDCQLGVVWAQLGLCPLNREGLIPTASQSALEFGGWVRLDHVADRGAATLDEGTAVEGYLNRQLWRSIAPERQSTLRKWVASVINTAVLALKPTSHRWYLHAELDVDESEVLGIDEPSFDLRGRWSIVISRLMRAGDWERAIWPSASESGQMACRFGLHQFHETPCVD